MKPRTKELGVSVTPNGHLDFHEIQMKKVFLTNIQI
jgi:hypothetical protein